MYALSRRLLPIAAALALGFAGCGGGGESRGDGGLRRLASPGKAKYEQACASCHGKSGEGVAGRGNALRGNSRLARMSDDEVFEVIRSGRRADHPENETGVEMPPKGGDTTMSQRDVREVIAYLRGF